MGHFAEAAAALWRPKFPVEEDYNHGIERGGRLETHMRPECDLPCPWGGDVDAQGRYRRAAGNIRPLDSFHLASIGG